MVTIAEDSGIKVETYSPKKDDRTMWSKRFMGILFAKNPLIVQALKGELTVPAEATVLDETKEIEEIKRRAANNTAYGYLMVLFQDADSFSAIDEARTTDLPNGDAEKAWKNLEEMYKPKNVQTKIKLKKKFNNCKLKPSMNPTTW